MATVGQGALHVVREATGPDQDLMCVVVVCRVVGDEDTVVVEGAVENEHMEVHVQLRPASPTRFSTARCRRPAPAMA